MQTGFGGAESSNIVGEPGNAAAVRTRITQPMTDNEGALCWPGAWVNGIPDPLLPLIDFASMRSYPLLEVDGWNWQQTAVAAGPLCAPAMMEASLLYLKAVHGATARAAFRTGTGATAHLATSMPVVIGETGWKARQTNPDRPIETHAARPVNQMWYHDLLRQWELSPGGPKIFCFVGFDEAWKGTDHGWGLWTDTREPRYVLCGLTVPSAPGCNPDTYEGAGYFR